MASAARTAGRGRISGRASALAWLVVACAPAPVNVPVGTASESGAVEVATGSVDCKDAACWAAAASAAERAGATDVAASRLGRAFVDEPTSARLNAWVDALLAGGEVRRAREGLEMARDVAAKRKDAGLVAEVERRLAGLPAGGGTLVTGPLSEAVKGGYAALAAGQLDAAAAGFVGVREPYHLAYAGEVQARRGDLVAASRSWAAARAGLYERGAALKLEPVETHFTRTAAWHGGELALMGQWSPIHTYQDAVGVLQLRAPIAGASVRRLLFAAPSNVVAFTADGLGFLREQNGAVIWQDLLSGAISRTVANTPGRVSALLSSGTGDDTLVLVAAGHDTTLWDARGKQVATYALAGTTPTITRVYRADRGTDHDNILNDSPTWPVALAMTERAELVAIGGSDSKIRVYSKGRGEPRELAYSWQYSERRHMGGNPDLNEPLALRFDAQERLIAVYTHGDILVWDPRGGTALAHHPGRCTEAEATTYVNRYVEPGASRKKPSEEEFVACGRASTGDITPDGSRVVTGGGLGGFRVRTAGGQSVHYDSSADLPDQHLRWAADGTLGMVDQNGEIAVWRRGQAAERVVGAITTGPLVPVVASDGRRLSFDLRSELVFWDLWKGRRLAVRGGPGERLLAVDGQLARAVIKTADAVEVRDVTSGEVVLRRAVAGPFSAGAVAGGATIVIDVTDAAGGMSLVIVGADGKSTTQATADGPVRAVSDDGRWLASSTQQGQLTVRALKMAGRVMHTLPAGVRGFGFSRDGARMGWTALPDPNVAAVKVHVQAVEGSSKQYELALQGWPSAVAFTPDGSELLVLTEGGRLTRWRWSTNETVTLAQVSLIGVNSAMVTADGKALLLAGYDHVQVRTNDRAMRRLATLYPLLRGGWVVVSSGGAVEGSDDAADSMILRATGGDATLVFPGQVGWDGAYVAGTWRRVLAGEDVAAPVLVHAPVVEAPL